MDKVNLSAIEESENIADSGQESSESAETRGPKNDIRTSELGDKDAEINESNTIQGSVEAASIEYTQGTFSEAMSSGSNDKSTEIEVKSPLTPVSGHAENSISTKNIDLAPHVSPGQGAAVENSKISANEESSLDGSEDNQNIINSSKQGALNIDDVGGYDQDINNSPYYIKWIMWKGLKTPIVTQNDNGPCPLLAIINILLLRRVIKFPSMQEMVTTQQLMQYLGNVVLKEIPENMGEGAQRNFEQNMQDAFVILPKLKTGLDVNVKFSGVGDFEFTPECVIFDLLNIHLYHGWLIDPQSVEYQSAIGGLSYNQLVEKIVASKETKEDSQLTSEGLFAETFLKETANQLTYYGICELNAKMNDDELCVFFRNNHFSTLYKHQSELFLLLTDQGFLTEDKIVWQTLSSVDGDGIFVDNNFKSLIMKNETASIPAVSSRGALSQEDQDYMLALSIQKEQQPQQASSQPEQQPVVPQSSPTQAQAPPESRSSGNVMSEQELFDLQYAMQLQEEEESSARTVQQRQQQYQQQQQRQQAPQRRAYRRQTPPPSGSYAHEGNFQQRSSGSNCVIL